MLINCKGKLIDLSKPKVMGIINVTPDSFYSGSRHESETEILESAEKMLKDGASFLDLGAYSSRPGAKDIPVDEELKRIIPAIESILRRFPEANLSIDTFRAPVASKSLEAGAAIINDISAGKLDEKMLPIIAKFQVPYIMMHMRGTPQTMKNENDYKDVTEDVIAYFSERVKFARDFGINDLILDPGFGFAKDVDQNYELFSKMELFRNFNLPLLVGVSRKSMIWKKLNTSSGEALNGTTVLNTAALLKGANILRVHDVKEAMECINLTSEILN
ncbi:dihydropteroate synthase [Christiangramia salexigens]|uniref:dihydropteroate synthase n=1 Tax=Christiangramia salexigens TaxID=1913577 RepID=A0A1L3J4W0_9FLAO|nr:dihydropteroate synthase [Christiangramia salexigens]APG60189.1 dihydropteroate synthase [Christiangramia salexigens]